MKTILINQEFAPKIFYEYFINRTKVILNKIIFKGYYEVNKIEKQSDTTIGKFLALDKYRNKNVIPEIKNLAIDYFLIQACIHGMLPFEANYQVNSNNTGHNLRMTTTDGKGILTVNQVTKINNSSRDAVYRKNMEHDLVSKLNLWGNDLSTKDDSSVIKYYFELTHGHQSLQPKFVALGMPNDKGGWIVKENLGSPFVNYTDVKPEEIYTAMNELSAFDKSDFEEFLSDFGNIN